MAQEGAALALARDVRVADPGVASFILSALGNAHRSMGDFSQAIAYHTQRLAIAREVGDRAWEGKAYGNLGNAHYWMGNFAQAIAYHTQDLEIAREVGDRESEGTAYGNLGLAHDSMGNFSQAIEYHTRVTATLTIISKDRTSSWPTFLFFRVDFLFCIRDFRVRCSLTQPLFLGAYLYSSYIYVL